MDSILDDLEKLFAAASVGAIVGRMIEITQQGQAIVDFPGNTVGPLRARSILAGEESHAAREDLLRRPVLLALENGDPTRPIIVGFVRDELFPSTYGRKAGTSTQARPELTADGQRVTLEANEEIVLRCGRSSITLKQNGKIVVKGADIISRASRTNKLKGAAVAIN
jgi:hypothetical protein